MIECGLTHPSILGIFRIMLFQLKEKQLQQSMICHATGGHCVVANITKYPVIIAKIWLFRWFLFIKQQSD